MGLDIANQSILSNYQIKQENQAAGTTVHETTMHTPIDNSIIQNSTTNLMINNSVMAN